MRNKFPIFQNHPELIYLDNAATTQKPQSVIDAELDFYTKHNANVHRGIYALSEEASELYDQARAKVAQFMGAKPQEIVFTSGTTDSINLLAQMLVKSKLLNQNSHILLTQLEHHANILPWQATGAQIEYLKPGQDLEIDWSRAEQNLKNYTLLSFTRSSNVTGTQVNVPQFDDNQKQPMLFLDLAQAVAHEPLNLSQLGVDFAAFSGHKMYGPTGIGVLYINEKWHDLLEPARVGGGQIRSVTTQGATWAAAPEKFEAGTPPIAQAMGLSAAVDWIERIGWSEILKVELELAEYANQALRQIPGLELFRPESAKAAGVFSFAINGIHPHDVAQVLADHNVAVRAGHHCAQILHTEHLNQPATTRASLAVYNTTEDIDRLVEALTVTLQTFRS